MRKATVCLTALALLGLLPATSTRVTGEVYVRGQNLVGLSEKQFRGVRGRDIGMVFQEPMTALDPVFRIGRARSTTSIRTATRSTSPGGASRT